MSYVLLNKFHKERRNNSMKACMTYTCEFCGYECKDYDDMMNHEANHLGITTNDLKTYIQLKRSLTWHKRCATVPVKDPDCREKHLERGQENLLKTEEKISNFEKTHNIDPNNPMKAFYIDYTGRGILTKR